VEGLLRRGAEQRATASTAANDASSRSHAVFIITFERSERLPTTHTQPPSSSTSSTLSTSSTSAPSSAASSSAPSYAAAGYSGGSLFRASKLNLVDLAGSERLRASNASGRRLEECKHINASLAALGNVIAVRAALCYFTEVPLRYSRWPVTRRDWYSL